MGGVIGKIGNASPLAEANCVNDPEAAKMVFDAGWKIKMCPLNVTRQWTMDSAFLEEMSEHNKMCQFVLEISRHYFRFYEKSVGQNFIHVHDSSAVLALVRPDLFTERKVVRVHVLSKKLQFFSFLFYFISLIFF